MKEDRSQQPKFQRRIFFALWPEQVTRDALNQNIKPDITHYLKTNPARKVPTHNWHLTLAFVGNVSDETFDCCLQQGSLVTAEAFSITLNKYDFFERPQIIWLGGEQIPDGWYELVSNLNEQLAICGYKPDRKHPIPHMTVVRKAKQPMKKTKFKPVTLTAKEFALIESRQTDKGVMYSVIRHWPLVNPLK